MSNTIAQSGYSVSTARHLDGTNCAGVLALLKDSIRLRTESFARQVGRSQRYVRLMLDGDRALPLDWFITILSLVARLSGVERVRQILQLIARPFGLDVVPSSDGKTKDLSSETIEAAGACGDAFAAVRDAIEDQAISDEEKQRVESKVRAAQTQLDDLVTSMRRPAR